MSQSNYRAIDPARHAATTAARDVIRTHPWWGPDHAYGTYDQRRSAAADRLAAAWAAARLDGPVPDFVSAARNPLLAYSDPGQLDVDLRTVDIDLVELFSDLEEAWPRIAPARAAAEKAAMRTAAIQRRAKASRVRNRQRGVELW